MVSLVLLGPLDSRILNPGLVLQAGNPESTPAYMSSL